MISASKAALLKKCQYWARVDVEQDPREESEAASRGTSVHKAIDEYIKYGAGLDESVIGTEQYDMFMHARIWLDEADRVFLSEVCFVWDGEFASREVGIKDRWYADHKLWAQWKEDSDASDYAVPMTIDLMSHNDDGSISVYDWCTGRTDKTAQLEMNAIAVWYAYHPTEVRTAALRLTEDGCVQEDLGVYDEWDIAVLAAQYFTLIASAPSSKPTPGMHCVELYCPAKQACPATRQAVEQIIPSSYLTRNKFTNQIESLEHASALLPMVKLAKSYIETVEKSLREMAKTQPIPTSEGKQWGMGTRKERRFDKERAIDLLKQKDASDEEIADCYAIRNVPVFSERKMR